MYYFTTVNLRSQKSRGIIKSNALSLTQFRFPRGPQSHPTTTTTIQYSRTIITIKKSITTFIASSVSIGSLDRREMSESKAHEILHSRPFIAFCFCALPIPIKRHGPRLLLSLGKELRNGTECRLQNGPCFVDFA